MAKRFRKRVISNDEDDDEERRLALEEIKLIQKQRERKAGIAANPASINPNGFMEKATEKPEAEGEEELVLQDTFAQETAVNVEDPNMLKYVEQELAKKRGRQELGNQAEEEKRAEDDLYVIPDHLKVRKRNAEESSTQWTTGIAEVQLPIEYKLRNIEETEAAKKQLQDRRPFVGRQRYPELHTGVKDSGQGATETFTLSSESVVDSLREVHSRRQAATDEIMLERFRKRERSRVMRR